MKILVIHQVPNRKVDYVRGLDHDSHDVTYIGFPHRMSDLPEDLRCRRLVLGSDEELAEGVISRTSPDDGFEKVIALSEFGMVEAWRIRRHLGLDGPTLDQVHQVRDKVAMKRALAGSGLRYPRFVDVPPADGRLPWTGRTVLKPRQGASSESVSFHDTPATAVAAYRAVEDPAEYQLEEYVEGDIFHADGLVQDGQLVHLAVSRYVNRPADFVVGQPLGSHHVPYEDRHHDFAARVVKALEIDEGCLHLEFFESPGEEPVFLEVANRMGGAGVVNAHLAHTGVHLPSHEIAIRLGLPRPQPEPPTGRYHAWLVFPGHHLEPRTGHTVTVPKEIRDDPCLDQLYVLDPDQPLPDHVTYHEWLVPVAIEASHRDPQVLRAFLQRCVRSISVRAGSV